MFRADFLPFTSKIVEHSRYLPARHAKQTKISVKQLVVFSAMLWLRIRRSGKPFWQRICVELNSSRSTRGKGMVQYWQ